MNPEAGWRATLRLAYARRGDATRADHAHHGPLRVLKALYPEGPAICHHVIVHPPAGIVGGDSLEVGIDAGEGAHALLTTPGASRFYRSEGREALQRVEARLARGARLEWLPGEAIAYRGALAVNQVAIHLAEGAQTIGWDIVALGLPAAGAPFDAGCWTQQLELHGAAGRLWLDRGVIDAADRRLLDSPLGLAGHPVLGTLWWACGCPLGESLADPGPEPTLDAALDEARSAEAPGLRCGATRLGDQLLVWRGLAGQVEPLIHAMRMVRGRWRERLWGLPPTAPRVWAT